MVAVREDGLTRQWQLNGLTVDVSPPTDVSPAMESISAIGISILRSSPSGRWLATGDRSGTLTLSRIADDDKPYQLALQVSSAPIADLQFSHDEPGNDV